MSYTKENVDTYIEYTHRLYTSIVEQYMPRVDIDRPGDAIDKYGKAIGDSLGMQAIIQMVFHELLVPFHSWLLIDCPFTGHKKDHSSISTIDGGQTHQR